MKSAQHFGDHGGAPRIRSAIAHSLTYVLALALVSRVATWFGLFLDGAHFVSAALLVCWLVAGFHRDSEHLCERCLREVPIAAPARAERQRSLLRFAHVAKSVIGCAVLAVVSVGPPLLAVLMPVEVPRLLYIPGDLWLVAIIYAEWVHHRLRPWCPFCDPWDEEGDEEPAPDPTWSGTKVIG